MEAKDFEKALDDGIRYLFGTDIINEVFGCDCGCEAGDTVRNATRSHGLLVDVSPTDEGYEMKTEVPGLAEDMIDVKYEKNIITITADYGEEGNGLRKGKFTFQGRLEDVDTTKIVAKLNGGILTIDLPKIEETKARKINITT